MLKRVFNGHSINIGASIGIALIDSYVEDASDILRYAHMALYRAKNDGSNRACIYDAAMDANGAQMMPRMGSVIACNE